MKIFLFTLFLIFLFIFSIIIGYAPLLSGIAIMAFIFFILYYLKTHWFVYLVLFTLSFAKLLNLPVTQGGFSFPVAVILCLFPLAIFSALVKKDRDLINTFLFPVDKIFPILFLIIMSISLMNSKKIVLSIRQVQQFCYIITIFYFLNLHIRDKKVFKKAIFITFVGGIFVGFFGLIEIFMRKPIYFMSGNIPKSILGATVDLKESVSNALVFVSRGRNLGMGRILGLLGDPTYHGIYIAFIFFLLLYVIIMTKRTINKIFCVLLFLILAVNILSTGSRGAFIALLIGLFIFWGLAEISNKAVLFAVFVGFFLFIIILVLFLVPNLDISRSFSFSETNTIEMRSNNISVALNIFLHNPILGTGPDGFMINYREYAKGISNMIYMDKHLRTHNTILQILAEYGIIGITMFTMIVLTVIIKLVTIIRYGLDRENRLIAVALLSGFAAYLFFMLTSNILLDYFFWLIISLSYVQYSVSIDELQLL